MIKIGNLSRLRTRIEKIEAKHLLPEYQEELEQILSEDYLKGNADVRIGGARVYKRIQQYPFKERIAYVQLVKGLSRAITAERKANFRVFGEALEEIDRALQTLKAA